MEATWSQRLVRLLHRWDPRAVLISDGRAEAAVQKLRDADSQKPADLLDARWVCDCAVHPVLEKPIPSAFRVGSFMPITGILSLGMISTKAPLATVVYHWLYQSHSAATRYCNYADTARPLSGERMFKAYAASTTVACACSLASISAVARVPSLKVIGMVVPHAAVAAAGALSTIMNAEIELRDGVPILDSNGVERGISRVAARRTIEQAVILHSLIIPGCALLMPALTMRTLVAPHLLQHRPSLLWPCSAALVCAGVGVLTPCAAACVPPAIPLRKDELEPELRDALSNRIGGDQVDSSEGFWSSRELY